MGLDISPGGAQWSYSGFMAFRERLAAEEEFNLLDMEGFCRHHPGTPWRSDTARRDARPIPWTEVKSPLVPLLSHSDCDGVLLPYECEKMLPRLREIRAAWSTRTDGYDPAKDYDTQQLGALIDGMAHCVQNGCAVVFRMTSQPPDSAARRPRARYVEGPVRVRSDHGDAVVELVTGSQPYLWIGRQVGDDVLFVGSVTVRAVLAAVKRSKK
jgi:hypothetical protein